MTSVHKLLVILVLTIPFVNGRADVKKQVKSEVSLGPIGTIVNTELVQIKGKQMYNQSLTEMTGGGMLGFAMKSMGATTNQITITDLNKQVIYILDMNEKTYREIRLKDYKTMIKPWKQGMQQPSQFKPDEETAEEPNYKVVRKQFKITKTGERKTIGGFSAEKYSVLWLVELQNTETGERMIDSLTGEIWTTSDAKMKKMKAEEMAFYEDYAKALDLPTNPYDAKMLGLSYLSYLGKMQSGKQPHLAVDADISRELKKISGYPVQIDTRIFIYNPDKPQEAGETHTAESQEPDIQQAMKQLQQLGGLFGRKKKKKPEPEPKPAASKGPVPVFTYHYSIVKVEFTPVSEKMFTIPPDFRKVEDGM